MMPKNEMLLKDLRGYEIISMGPPSSGGISLIYLLNILENYDLRNTDMDIIKIFSL